MIGLNQFQVVGEILVNRRYVLHEVDKFPQGYPRFYPGRNQRRHWLALTLNEKPLSSVAHAD